MINMVEKRLSNYLNNLNEREKTIERSIEYRWKELNEKDVNLAILEWNTKEIHDYRIMLNEIGYVRDEIKSILADIKDLK